MAKVAPVTTEQRDEQAFNRLTKALGKSKERFRLFEELAPTQQAVVRETVPDLDRNIASGDLEALGLPPYNMLARWAGLAHATVLEQRAGKWPVWKWLKAATLDEVSHDAAIRALAKGLHATQLRDLVWLVSTGCNEYDLWGERVKQRRGESAATQFTAQVIRLLGALIDAAGPDVALTFAKRAENHLAKYAERWLAAAASFGLVARARRLGEPFPRAFYALARESDSLGYGVLLREAFRDIVELVPMIDREAFVIKKEPHFLTSSFEEIKGGREVQVPCLLHDWLIADLVPTPRMAEALVADVASWTAGPQPKKEALAVISAMGTVCAPFLEQALKKSKAPHKAVLAQALKLVGGKAKRRA